MIIKLDIDGVLRDMLTPMVECYNKEFGTSLTKEDITDYDVQVSFPEFAKRGIDGFKFFFEEHMRETIIDAKSFYGICDAIKKFKDNGHIIKIVSYQPSVHAKIKTLEWLDRNGVDYDYIVFTNKPSKKDIPCDAIIDDRCEYLDEVDEHVIRMCIDQPYNRHKDYQIRAGSLNELAADLFETNMS